MMQRSITGIDQRDDLPREQRAWFHYRLGELELRVGRYAAADSAFLAALERSPDDVRALSGLARVALARGDVSRAVSYGEQVIGLQLDPATLATLSRAFAAMGDSVRSAEYGAAMSMAVLSQPGAIHRTWGLHLLDHGTPAQRAEVLRRARAELRERSDVYGHDLLAWALFRAGRRAEARKEMRLALAQGTEDLLLQQHSQAIFSPF
jgi:tetratricopeptide (TPR) repeat protein